MRKKLLTYSHLLTVVMLSLLGFSSCDIHEYPSIPETTPYKVQLVLDSESMFEWDILTEWEYKDTTRSYIPEGTMRYIIRLYPASSRSRSANEYVQEHIVYGMSYDMHGETFTLDLKPGKYNMMIWADMEIPGTDCEYYYDAKDFSDIYLARHQGNTDYRDGFRGVQQVEILSDIYEKEPGTIVVEMERPFAKYEIISNDLGEFIEKQLAALLAEEKAEQAEKAENAEKAKTVEDPESHEGAERFSESVGRLEGTEGLKEDEANTKSVDLNDYKVVIAYPGFMPSAYDMFIDKPVNSLTGISFESTLKQIGPGEASLGFDYIFVNGAESGVTVQIGLYTKDGEQLALTEPMNIVLSRGKKTIVKGSFLMQQASGSIGINPDYDGEYNYEIKW